MQLVIPMTGKGSRFFDAGFSLPKPMIPIGGRSILERLLDSFPKDWKCLFVVNEDHRSYGIESFLKKLRPDCEIHFRPHAPDGPGQALLSACDLIDPTKPVFVSYCDYGQSWDPIRFEQFVQQSECDLCLVSYRGFHAHYLTPQTYAYSRLDGDRVVEVKEKGSFTSDRENEFASTGGYYFRSAKLLRQGLEQQFKTKLFMNGESYTSLTMQALLQSDQNLQARVFEVDTFFQWGTPFDLQSYEFWEKSYFNFLKAKPLECEQVLMPMAGFGSRFQKVSPVTKPFIPMNGMAMYERALKSLPKAKRNIVVAKKEHEKNLVPGLAHAVLLDETPPGQALTVAAGLKHLNPDQPVFISACDHGLSISPAVWSELNAGPYEAAIFTIEGFPGTQRSPTSYAYVASTEDPKSKSKVGQVTSVSVKKPLSSEPQKDSLLVGSFWFRSVKLLDQMISQLQRMNKQVNGELYLDSVFELYLESKKLVAKAPLDSYLCWGDPDSFAESLYWQEYFLGQRLLKRPRFPILSEL